MPADLPVLTLLGLVLAAFVAGWVDAVVGGGGLIQLPALLIGLPGSTAPAAILGTNKVSSVWGTATSSITYAVKIRPDWRTVLPLVAGSALGSAAGAQLARFMPEGLLHPDRAGRSGRGRPVHLAPTAAGADLGAPARRSHPLRATAAIGLGVGAYDGFLGPGTGSFFVILLVGVLGYGFLEASAKAKIANLTTNLAAIAVFGLHGSVLWGLGLTMGAANLVGGFLGARMAIRRGNAFVRRVFLVVLAGLVLKLSYDVVVSLVR